VNDLFGNPIIESTLPLKDAKKKPGPNGYAARPGSGPKGETCRSCEFAVRTQPGRKVYWKCWMFRKLGGKWTHGYGTDILLKTPACSYWQIHKLSPFKNQ
jgi:hypothetical protein